MTKLNNRPLKYLGYSIVFQEVPNEISLAINISGCPYKCEGCHSDYLWEYKGFPLSNDIEHMINSNPVITCVCFMGGEQNIEELKNIIKTVKKHNLKVCLYSGSDDIRQVQSLLKYLDFLKIGSYQSDKGGLNSLTTNQRMFKVIDGRLCDDITFMFTSKYKHRNIIGE